MNTPTYTPAAAIPAATCRLLRRITAARIGTENVAARAAARIPAMDENDNAEDHLAAAHAARAADLAGVYARSIALQEWHAEQSAAAGMSVWKIALAALRMERSARAA